MGPASGPPGISRLIGIRSVALSRVSGAVCVGAPVRGRKVWSVGGVRG